MQQWVEVLQVLQFKVATCTRVFIAAEGEVEIPVQRLETPIFVSEKVIIDTMVSRIAIEVHHRVVECQHPKSAVNVKGFLSFFWPF